MPTTAKLNLSVGDRSISMEMTGMDMERQRNALHSFIGTFFDDFDAEIGIDVENEVIAEEIPEVQEVDLTHEALNMKENDYKEMTEAFAKIEIEPKEEMVARLESLPRHDSTISYSTNRSIKKNTAGMDIYQTYYICTKCKNRGKHYLTAAATFCTCHECGHHLKTRSALEDSDFPTADEYGNIFIAGDFLRTEERKEFFGTLHDAEQEAATTY